jgi:quercetin dioxygenase-like cupin family protein
MQVSRFEDASRYDAPQHYDMRSLRLQGFDVTDSKFAWVGLSHFLPGGGADMSAGNTEKIYVVLAGNVTVEIQGGPTEVLGPLDSCLVPAGEARAVRNDGNDVASMLVIMPYAEAR